jgi:hypothetical protein
MIYPSLNERLKNQHTAISAIILNLVEERLNDHPEPGKWSIHDNIAHLAKYQPLFIGRIHSILTFDNPAFERYNADEDPEFKSWQAQPLSWLLSRIDTDRQLLFELITGLPDDKLERKGLHRKFGDLTVLKWAEFFLLHEAHHLYTIFQLANGVVG